jgi:superfamily II DNA or RNA helicase
MLREYQKKIIRSVQRAGIQGRKRPCIVAPCGSGKTVIAAELARLTTSMGRHVLFVVHRKELCDQTVKAFRRYGVDMKLCIVGMVKSLMNRKMPLPDLIIMDENHHILAKSYIEILERFPKAFVVGLTATPVRLGNKGLGEINDELIIGPTVKELIEMGYLAPFKYYSHISADTSALQVRQGEFVKSQVDKIMSKDYIYGDAVEHYKRYNLGKTIVYCSSITNSTTTAEAFQSAGISAVHVGGKTLKAQRSKIMEDFRAGRLMVLCNVDLVSEGFDVPDCDSVILMRPTMSLTLHIQQSMRCMRLDPKNPSKIATIIDMVQNFARHGLPDTEHKWNLDFTSQKMKHRICFRCSAVYDMNIAICNPCGGWDLRRGKCSDCGLLQQYGFGLCDCGSSNFESRHHYFEREQVDEEFEEIKSFTFENTRNYAIIDGLRRIQKENALNLSWVYHTIKDLGI